ncbi:MAG: hypothetical protein MMC33_005355 [Icmadophila ericetorum]|nr:hypothetical protein [Icmadophila ericetorum]
MAAAYGVDSLHINVEAGDAAVHLLIQIAGLGIAASKPTVIKAIIIDGGDNTHKAPDTVQKVFDETLLTKYTWPNNAVKFDAVIITHWDSDHYKGLVKLMIDDILEQQGRTPPVPDDNIQISFFKYVGTQRLNPQTTLFCPYWNVTGRGKAKPKDHWLQFQENQSNLGFLDFYPFVLPRKRTTRKNALVFEKIARLDYSNLLGMEFFFKSKLTTPSDAQHLTPSNVFLNTLPTARTAPLDPTMPGMFCVASNKLVLGQPVTSLTHNRGSEFIIGGNTTHSPTNASSIAAMIIWSSPNSITGSPLSHYFGGDSEEVSERAIVTWTAGSTVANVKASHHGSATSFPAQMFLSFQPWNIIISAGGEYGHPRYELMYYIAALNTNPATVNKTQLFTMGYPYWFAKDSTGKYIIRVIKSKKKKTYLEISTKAFDENVLYAGLMHDAYIGRDHLNPVTSYADLDFPSNTDIVAKLTWIIKEIEQQWAILSGVDPCYFPETDLVGKHIWTDSSGAYLSKRSRILCHIVKSRSNSVDRPKIVVDNRFIVGAEGVKATLVHIALNGKTILKQWWYKRTNELPIRTGVTTALLPTDTTGIYNVDIPWDDKDEADDDENVPATLMRVSRAVMESPVVPPTPNPPVVPSTGYYFCSSLVQQASGTTNAHNIDVNTDLDTLVSNLHVGWIGFDAAPTSTKAATLLADDEWGTWWTQVFSNATLTAFGDSADITSFNLVFTFAATSLHFSTSNVVSAFGLTATTPESLLYPGQLLILGLGIPPPPVSTMARLTGPSAKSLSTTSVNVSLAAILSEVGLQPTAFGIDLTVDPGLNVTLDLDSSGERSAVWFVATRSYDTILRLVFQVNDVTKINSIFTKVGLALVSAQIIVRQTHQTNLAALDRSRASELAIKVQLRIGTESQTALPFSAVMKYDVESQETIIIVQCDFNDAIERFVSWVEGLLSIHTGISSFLKSDWVPKPRRVTLTIDTNRVVTSFTIDFEVHAPFGGNVAFLFTYKWVNNGGSELSASLWPVVLPILNSSSPTLKPEYEDYDVFQPLTGGTDTSISIANFIPGNPSLTDLNIPQGIPTDVAALGFILSSVPTASSGSSPSAPTPAGSTTTNEVQVEFFVSLECEPPTSKVPAISLTSLGLDVMYTFGSSDFKFSLQFKITLESSPDSTYDPAVLEGTVDHSSTKAASGSTTSTWQITASVHDLYIANLFDLFESESQNGVMALIEGIEIVELDLTYDYDSSGEGSHFLITGTLLLGQAQLELSYEHFLDSWEFSAELTDPSLVDKSLSNPVGETINGLLSSISSDFSLPNYVGNIQLPSDASVSLDLRKTNIGTAIYIVFQIEITIGAFDAIFIQYKTDAWAGPKRVFRALVSTLDLPDNVPIIDKFAQPFDEMHFMYVQDKSGPTPQGILRQEMDLLNEKATRKFIFQETKKPGNMKPLDVVIVPNLHFVIVLDLEAGPTIVLDHIFGSQTQSQSLVVRRDTANDADSSSDSDASMGALQKTIGPITISNIGIQFKSGHLIIILDATVMLGPIELELLGAGLDLDFTGSAANLLTLPPITFVLNGLGFGYSKPPVVASGLFERQGEDFFVGGVVVAFEPYLFMASGCYGIVDDFKTVALFCKLAGPLVELEFAEISGICGGFGYNSLLRFPTIDEIFNFPFVKQDQIGGTPLDTLKLIGNNPDGWVKPTKSSLWLAAGLTADAAKLITITAVVVIDFQPTVKLGIFADAVASFPPAPSPIQYVYVELGLAATVDFAAGSMLVEGQLAPTSYIYVPACHLTGGFALGYWFGSSGHAGDWVFTIGGYHPAYKPPSHYPVPDRLAISWNLDDALSILGEAYFALTPKVCMGGGMLKASLSLSPLYAYFEAYADFLIKFDPFYFTGDIGVSVGVQFTLDLWICTIHINIDIGAMIHLEGPPMHGFVHVDFWVFGFDIYFGDQHPAQQALTQLLDFYNLLKQQDLAKTTAPSLMTQPRKQLTADPTPAPTPIDDLVENAHRFNCVGGLFVPSDQAQTVPSGQTWQVRAGSFQFSVDTVFAANSGSVLQGINGGSAQGSGKSIYSRPMELSGTIDSQITVEVYTEVDDPKTKLPVKKTVANFSIDSNIKNVPLAMWGQYTSAEDPLSPSSAGNQIGTLLDGTSTATVPLMMGLTLTHPPPKHSIEDGHIAPFNAADAMSEIIDTATFQPLAPVSPSLRPVQPVAADEWTKVPQLWEKLGAAQQDGGVSFWAVQAWVGAMGWVVPDEGIGARVPGQLVGGFDDYYLAPPMVSVS